MTRTGRYFEAPVFGILTARKAVFLAGTITGAENWQQEASAWLLDRGIDVFNPRRENFPIDDPAAARKQIEWESDHITAAAVVAFWFPKEGLSPITLYELGKCSALNKRIAVSVEPGFWREEDVRIQTELIRPEVRVGSSFAELMSTVKWMVKS